MDSAALRRSLSEAVRIDQGMLRYVLDQSRDCIKILGPAGEINYVNSEGRCALEINDISTVLGKRWPDLWPEDARPIIAEAVREAQGGQSRAPIQEAKRAGGGSASRL